MTYKFIKDIKGETIGIRKIISETINEDGTWKRIKLEIPVCDENADYQEYLAWVAEGNTADAAD